MPSVDFCGWVNIKQLNSVVSGPEFTISFSSDVTVVNNAVFEPVEISAHSGDIRHGSIKLSEIAARHVEKFFEVTSSYWPQRYWR